MAQGVKKLAQGGNNKKQQRHHNKKTGPKKGRTLIAPKKTKLVEASKLQRGLERAINQNIEQQVSVKASSVEPKSFHIFKPPTGANAIKSKNKK